MLRPVSLIVPALVAVAFLSAGCSSKRVTLDEAMGSDITPELGHQGLSDQQARYREAIVVDHNLRAMRDDLSRFWFFDQPSRLTPRAVP
ncbi:MAG: hypothetical protein AAF586_04400 [Planctomycetota bacterium]